MAAAGRWKFYEKAKLHSMDGTYSLPTNTYKIILLTSSSNANTLSGNEKYADLTNELSTANGYTAGGNTLGSVTWTNSTGTETFISAATTWNATGAGITARFAVIYLSGTLGGIVNPLMCVCLLDATPADVTAAAGSPFTVTMNASGIFTLSGASTD